MNIDSQSFADILNSSAIPQTFNDAHQLIQVIGSTIKIPTKLMKNKKNGRTRFAEAVLLNKR